MKNRDEFIQYVITQLDATSDIIGAEIGGYKCAFSRELLRQFVSHLYIVDVWAKQPEEEYTDKSNMENPYEIMKDVFDNLDGYENYSTLIRSKSEKAYKLFPDEYFDFIYIDGNHKYKYVKQDIELWWPKLKVGGIFAGHDYIKDYREEVADENGDTHVWMFGENNEKIYCGLFGVNKAVNEFFKEKELELKVTDEYFGTWFGYKYRV